MEFRFKRQQEQREETVVFLIAEGAKSLPAVATVDQTNIVNDALSKNNFSGKMGQFFRTCTRDASGALRTIILAGVGEPTKLDDLSLLNLGGKIAEFANQNKIETFEIYIEGLASSEITEETIATQLMLGIDLKAYRFNKYFVDKKDEHIQYLKEVSIALESTASAQKISDDVSKIAKSVYFTRDLVSEPANILFPESFAKICKELESQGVKVKVIDREEMKKLGMNLLLGVGQGSVREPYTVIMEWNGNPSSKEPPLALIGKGVTFDTGGINIKTSNSISDMKYDMGGAAVVTGLIHLLSSRKAKANVIGAIGLVENMPSGSAQRPSDVVVSMSGQTVEVDNTDAEGRLVLADVLHYVNTTYKPKVMIDLATLTGAIVVALGECCYAGLFSNDDTLADKILAASKKSGELAWRLPLHDYYDKQINSEIADVRNTGTGHGGGSITAAHFLKRFVGSTAWAHLDIAGVTWNKKGNDITPKGATAFGVRLLNQFVLDNYEAA